VAICSRVRRAELMISSNEHKSRVNETGILESFTGLAAQCSAQCFLPFLGSFSILL
jgi:hypothetical protein